MSIFEFALPLCRYALYEVGVIHTYAFMCVCIYKNIIQSTDYISVMFG